MNERSENENRWRHTFEWIDPRQARFDESNLHWGKISPEAVSAGFEALERLRHEVDLTALGDGDGFRAERQRLEALYDNNGNERFKESDLRWFDTFFGGDRIKVDALAECMDVTNGRHRLWMAQQCGITSLPALVARKSEIESSTSKKGEHMGMELNEVVESTEQQETRAGELKEEVEAHQQRIEKLDVAVKELKDAMQTLASDGARQALEAMQNAKRETERLLEEKRVEQQKLLDENERMGTENTKAYKEASQALQKVEAIVQMAGGEEGSLSGHLNEMQSSLRQDMQYRVDTDIALVQARQKLQLIF